MKRGERENRGVRCCAGNLQSFVSLFVVGITRDALQGVTVIFGDGIGFYGRVVGSCERDRKWVSIGTVW